MKKISCIIPAYNEAKNIRKTLEVVCAGFGTSANPLCEIIVINDASIDSTAQIVSSFPQVTLITNPTNQGKSATVATGIERAIGEYIFMLDADLIGLTPENIVAITQPINDEIADVTISIRKNTPQFMKNIGVDFMSGERVFPKSMLAPHIPYMKSMRGFGLEVFINPLIIEQKYRLKSVIWENVSNDLKYTKRGLFLGAWLELNMWIDILKTVPLTQLFYQNRELQKLLVK